jgi:hypothetical protein
MRAITIHQPWASLITLGEKRYETRAWQTSHRGRVAIHAGRGLPADVRVVLGMPPFFEVLSRHAIRDNSQLIRGAVIGVAELVDCVPTETVEREVAGTFEEQFGDFRPGRWAWKMIGAVAFAEPVPYRGKLGMFDVPDRILEPALCGSLAAAV